MRRILPHTLIWTLFGAVAQAQSFKALTSPCPLPGPCPSANSGFEGGQFGFATVLLDFDGDGFLDVAVSEVNQDCVYIFRGPNPESANPIRFAPSGQFTSCPGPAPTGDHFGASLAKGEYDGSPGDELFVGAPKALGGRGEIYIFSRANSPTKMTTGFAGVEAFGTSIAVADLDHDGLLDIAVGAPATPRTGRVAVGTLHIFSSLSASEVPLLNPAFFTGAGENGYYGDELDVGDIDGDGWMDLFVSALGNLSSAGHVTGAVYLHRSPVVGTGAAPPQRIDDPLPLSCELGARFGRTIDVRSGLLGVSAQRKDPASAICMPGYVQVDAGAAFLFSGPSFSGGLSLPDLSPSPFGLFGFNVVFADVLGGAEPDIVVASLEDRQLQIWDRGNFAAGPQLVIMPADSVYWAFDSARGELDLTNSREELLFGDPRALSCAGRVLLLTF